MQERAALGRVLTERFAWADLPALPTDERVAFERACAAFEEYRRAQPAPGGSSASSTSLSDTSTRSSAPAAEDPGPRISRSLRVFCAWKPVAGR